MQSNDLDGKLRERGRNKLKKYIEESFNGVPHSAGSMKVDVYKNYGTDEKPMYEKIYLSTLRGEYKDYLFKNLTPEWEQNEVDEFMRQVDSLQDQLDEIKEGVY